MACFKCNSNMLKDEQYYFVSDLGPELLSIIEQQISYEIADGAFLCNACFNSITNTLANATLVLSSGQASQDILSFEQTTDILPPEQASDILPSEQATDILPSEQATDILPSEQASDILPSEQAIDILPSEQASDILPSEQATVTLPSEQASAILSSEQARAIISIQPADTNCCVWCLSSLSRRRTHALPYGLQWDVISARIAPRQIPNGSIVCHRCWISACRISGNATTVPGNARNNCVWCMCSLALRRTHSVPLGPMLNEIAARIAPRQILPGDKVCHACYLAARRNINRVNHPHLYSGNRRCLVYLTSLTRRRTHLVSSSTIQDVISRRIHPRQIPSRALVCDECWAWAQSATTPHLDDAALQNEERIQPAQTNSVELPNFKKVGMSSASCFVPGCTNNERHAVPKYLRKDILERYKIYISNNARICIIHKTTYNWDDILNNVDNFSNVFSPSEIEEMILLNQTANVQLNFAIYENMNDEHFKYWTRLTKNLFSSLLNEVPQLSQIKIPKTALGLYLSHRRLKTLFNISIGKITRLLRKVTEILIQYYVPRHLGLGHMTQEDIINRNLVISEGCFGNIEERHPIVIFDGTYIYIQKSSNYLFQKLTYSPHKYRNLVKPFLVVTTDGHIIDVCGPYPGYNVRCQYNDILIPR